MVDFYPSISEDLLTKALSFAAEYDEITEEEKEIVIQAKRSVLFNDNQTWCKKSADSHFDVTMGSFDGAETCELVGSYLLSQLPLSYRSNIGLYRDDGLAAFKLPPRKIECIKKKICSTFGKHNLKLTIEANKKCVNFLDVTLDLRTQSFRPYTKPGNTPQYINRHSNHPPPILRNLPAAINRRLSNISSDKRSFDSAAPPYQEALRKSGYNYNLNFDPQPSKDKRSRQRNILWFNPPYNANVATNIGHTFLKIIDECFPKSNLLHKIFNRNTVKLSYSCMPSMEKLITAKNQSILRREVRTSSATDNACNCRQPNACPVDGKCLNEGIVYQAIVTREDNSEENSYVGLTEGKFKTRYANHNTSFRHDKYRNSTELSKHIWSLKDADVKLSIKWKILKKCKPYSNATKRYNLCLYEKFVIIRHPELSSLNCRNELVSGCRHRKKHLLCSK